MWSLLASLFTAHLYFLQIGNAVKYPQWSWDHVPVFMHTCNTSGPWNNKTLQYFTKFPIITFTKGSGLYATEQPYASQYAEDKIIEACTQIKALKPEIICILYYNSIRDWTYYKLHDTFIEHPSWWLRDNNQQIVLVSGANSFPKPAQGLLVPDYRQKIVSTFWASECYNITSKNIGIIDGCFSDTAQINSFPGYNFTAQDLNEFEIGHNASLTLIQSELNKTNSSIVIADNGWVPEGVLGTMIQKFEPNENNIKQLLSFSEVGILIQARSDKCNGGATQGGFINTLAAFLIGANKYSYYACSDGFEWPDNWNKWHAAYDKPLGEPVGAAFKNGTVYRRSFKSGTTVTFDTSTNNGTIIWANDTTSPS
eukprot:71636_1